jgi:hypothetical protein
MEGAMNKLTRELKVVVRDGKAELNLPDFPCNLKHITWPSTRIKTQRPSFIY